MSHRATWAAAAAVTLLGGCAERGLAAGPRSPTGTGTWALVVVAIVAVTGVLAAIVVVTAARPGGSKFASWVLGLQAAGVAVAGAIVAGAAVRTHQLRDQGADAEQAASLLRLSGIDGRDSGFFVLVVAVTVVGGGLLFAVLALAARCAADADPTERALATGLLAIEVMASLVCWVLVGLGFRHLGFVLPAAALPLLTAAAVAAWPRGVVADPA